MIGVAFGGNLKGSDTKIKEAFDKLSQVLVNSQLSPIERTEPLGSSTTEYFNAVMVSEESTLSLKEFWERCLQVEREGGRDRRYEVPWGDRSLDVDLLFFHDNVVAWPDLVLPHPQMHRRDFVLDPLKKVCPSWEHTLLKLSIDQMRSHIK